MHVRFAVPELTQIDALRCEALALAFFSDERPLRGALGLCDWRMCGFVSRMITRAAISGAWRETTLMPARPKLALDKLFLFGLGAQDDFDQERLRELVPHMLDTVSKAGVRTTALVLPGRSTGRVAAGHAMEALLLCARGRDEHDELILLEPHEAQREMERVLERERRRARATLE
jgi:hypothetical protein